MVLGQQRLLEPGGSETYVLTIGEQLQRLGHEVTIFAIDIGQMADLALARGLRVCESPLELPSSCDGVLAQDGVVSLLLADRYPKAAHVWVAHGPGSDLHRPVQLPGVVSAVVAMNDRVVRRLEGLAQRCEIVRLRQPIDVHRFIPRDAPRSTPETAVLLSNYLDRAESKALEQVCSHVGVRLERIGGHPDHLSTAPDSTIAAADIVFSHGRGALEGMAMGRAVYVLHRWGRDGWVTPDSYPALEADGFAGRAFGLKLDEAHLLADLVRYRPQMGRENRRLALQNHHELDHARELVNLLRRLSRSPRKAPVAPLREMARLVRLQGQTDWRCGVLTHENSGLRTENAALREHLEEERARAREEVAAARSEDEERAGAWEEVAAARSQVEEERARAWEEVAAARSQVEEERARAREEVAAASGQLEGFRRTRRYRLATLLGRPLDALRRRRLDADANALSRNESTSDPQTSAPKHAKAP